VDGVRRHDIWRDSIRGAATNWTILRRNPARVSLASLYPGSDQVLLVIKKTQGTAKEYHFSGDKESKAQTYRNDKAWLTGYALPNLAVAFLNETKMDGIKDKNFPVVISFHWERKV